VPVTSRAKSLLLLLLLYHPQQQQQQQQQRRRQQQHKNKHNNNNNNNMDIHSTVTYQWVLFNTANLKQNLPFRLTHLTGRAHVCAHTIS